MMSDRGQLPDFWITSGVHLLEKNEAGALVFTPDFFRAYLERPELAPVENSCEVEIALYESLRENPFQRVDDVHISAMEDVDAQDNYRLILAFRDLLVSQGSLEAAYLAIVRGQTALSVPPLFIDQLVHAILRNILDKENDPIRLRAAELFFRDQNVSTDDGRVMLADDEIVEMTAESDGLGGLGQLLKESNTPIKQIELDVLNEDNKQIYWERSDRFDTVIDFRFTQPALDGFARVVEAWIKHFTKLDVRILPLQRIDDEKWRWHIGLDVTSTDILNALYKGDEVSEERSEQIIGLFRMSFENDDAVLDDVRGRPVYLAVAKSDNGKLKLKPQNLLVNLPLAREV